MSDTWDVQIPRDKMFRIQVRKFYQDVDALDMLDGWHDDIIHPQALKDAGLGKLVAGIDVPAFQFARGKVADMINRIIDKAAKGQPTLS